MYRCAHCGHKIVDTCKEVRALILTGSYQCERCEHPLKTTEDFVCCGAETNAMIEIRHNNDLRNRVMRTLNARLYPLEDCTAMIRIDDILALTPGMPEKKGIMMEIRQLRDLLGQLGYGLMRRDDLQEIIQQHNEDADTPRCPECGHKMESGEGWRCAGYACPECGHEHADNTHY